MFILHPKLAADTFVLGDFPLSRLLLMNEARFPWFILVPRRSDIREIFELPGDDQQQLLRESSHLARCVVRLFRADKLNIAALGNLVPQLHLHHVVRHRDDPCWPDPVWGKLAARPYTSDQVREIHSVLIPDLEKFTAAEPLQAS